MIEGISDMDDLYKQTESFFNSLLLNKEYKIEHYSHTKVSISFGCQEYLYDFFRFMNYLKFSNILYQNIKMTKIIPSKKKGRSMNSSTDINKSYQGFAGIKGNLIKIKKKSLPKFSSCFYVNCSGPYISIDDIRREEYKENKKKWISNKDFVSAVGSGKKYNNKFID